MSDSSHTPLIERIAHDFAPRHARSGRTWIMSRKRDRESLALIEVETRISERLPDVVILDQERDWLFLVDVPTRDRRMDQTRLEALTACFAPCGKHLVIFSAYRDSDHYGRFTDSIADSIAWVTHVWVADTPEHMIHYGQPFRGPMSAVH